MVKRSTLPKKQKVKFSWQEEKELDMLRKKVKRLRELQRSLKLEFPGEKQIDLGVTIRMAVQRIKKIEKTKA